MAAVVRSGRARWKTENENHHTLKNRGYHLAHHFGQGRQFLSMRLVTLNRLAFVLHTVRLLTDRIAQPVRSVLGSDVTFWGDLRTLTRYLYFQSWVQLLQCMATQLELASSPLTLCNQLQIENCCMCSKELDTPSRYRIYSRRAHVRCDCSV